MRRVTAAAACGIAAILLPALTATAQGTQRQRDADLAPEAGETAQIPEQED